MARAISTLNVWRGASRYLAATAVVAVILGLAVTREVWLKPLRTWLSSAPATEEGHGHGEGDAHDHEGHAHGAGDPDSIEVSEQGRKNIGLRIEPVALKPFSRSVTIPGVIVERPGRTVVRVGTPFNAIVTKIYPIAGEAIRVGDPLFDVRLTHEELVQAQVEFLSTAEELNVLGREIERLEAIAPGTVAGKQLLERKYEQQVKQALLRAKRESLLLHGLAEEQVNGIYQSRTLLRQITVRVPPLAADQMGDENALFQVQQLAVDGGEYVEAGKTLVVLTNHAELYIEGRAFEQDIAALQQARTNGWPLAATVETKSGKAATIANLKVLYIAGNVDADSRTFRFFVTLPNDVIGETSQNGHRFIDWRYRPGQRMQLAIPIEPEAKKIVLPADALADDGAETYVFVPNGKKLVRRPVHVQHRDANNVVIASDGALFPGDPVVVAGARPLQLALKNKAGGGVDPHAGHNH